MKSILRKLFRKSLARETVKLMHQNKNALIYFEELLGDDLPIGLNMMHERLQEKYVPGESLDSDELSSALEINKSLRSLYREESPKPIMKDFDEEFSPLLGWGNVYQRFGL